MNKTRQLTLNPPPFLTEGFTSAFNLLPEFVVRVPTCARLLGFQSPDSQWRQLSVTLDHDIWIAAASINTPMLSLKSLDSDEMVDLRLTELDDKSTLGKRPLPDWALPAAAAAWGLQEYGLATPGIKAVIAGNVGEAVDIASAHAVTIGIMLALRTITNWQIDKMKMARICAYSHTHFLGRKADLSDSFTLLFGETGQILALDGRSEEWVTLPFPEDVTLVLGRLYEADGVENTLTARQEAEYSQLIAHAREFLPGLTSIRDLTEEHLGAFADQLPETMQMRAMHILKEDARVMKALDVLKWEQTDAFGALLDDSTTSLEVLAESLSPRLRVLLSASQGRPGRLGVRPLNGTSPSTLLFLVRDDNVPAFIRETSAAFREAGGGDVTFTTHKTASMADLMPYQP